MVSKNASKSFVYDSKSVSLLKGAVLKEILYKWMDGYLYLWINQFQEHIEATCIYLQTSNQFIKQFNESSWCWLHNVNMNHKEYKVPWQC
jgi:hypothetical protein